MYICIAHNTHVFSTRSYYFITSVIFAIESHLPVNHWNRNIMRRSHFVSPFDIPIQLNNKWCTYNILWNKCTTTGPLHTCYTVIRRTFVDFILFILFVSACDSWKGNKSPTSLLLGPRFKCPKNYHNNNAHKKLPIFFYRPETTKR